MPHAEIIQFQLSEAKILIRCNNKSADGEILIGGDYCTQLSIGRGLRSSHWPPQSQNQVVKNVFVQAIPHKRFLIRPKT